MAHYVKTTPLERILDFINPEISSGSTGDLVYPLSIYLRRDGVIIKLGYLVKRTGVEIVYIVREILVRGDIKNVTVAISPIENCEGHDVKMKEELLVVDVGDVNPVKGRMVSLELARDGMRKVASNIVNYPQHIQRLLRKHQLATQIRNSVQKFLAGFSLARRTCIGCVDWRLDPGLLGLERETDFSLEYRVERFAGGIMSHLDLLLGDGWDVRKVGGGFRVILTLELTVDVNQQIRLDTHATLCQGELNNDYRTKCMDAFANNVNPPTPNFLLFSRVDTTEHLERTSVTPFASLQSMKGAGISLDWDEFQDSQDETTLEVDEMNHTIEATELSQNVTTVVETETAQDSPDAISNYDGVGSSPESSSAIKKLLDTPTKAFSQIVFNVSNKPSGDSDESRAEEFIDKVSDSLVDDIVSKVRNVTLSEDSLERTLEEEKSIDQYSKIETGINPITRLQEDDSRVEEIDFDTSALPNSYEQSSIRNIPSPMEPLKLKQKTSTPARALNFNHNAEGSMDADFIDNCQDDIDSGFKTCEHTQEITDDSRINQLSGNRAADDTFENISDIIYDEKSINSKEVKHLSLQSSPDPVISKDGILSVTSPEEDLCSEDYRVSSSNEMHQEQELSKASLDVDGDTVITSLVKDPTMEQSYDNKTGEIITPESIAASPQSVVSKVAAYVQSLPSPQTNNGIKEVAAEDPKDEASNSQDESAFEDGANHSLTSSRSRASRHSELSNLTGRFSSGVGGIFYGAALAPSGAPSGQTVCPFPDEWQFNTIPESIENDEDID